MNFSCRENIYAMTYKSQQACIEWRVIIIVDPKRERDVVKQEASGSASRGSYVLGRRKNRSSNPILKYVKTLEVN